MATFIGIDYGTKRVGIAVGDTSTKIAFPREVVSEEEALSVVTKLCADEKVTGIVIGHSQNYKGEDNVVMKDARIFAEKLGEATKLPIHFEPEFLTSREASHIQGEHDMLDASAAAIMLQSFLDRNHHDQTAH